MHVIDVPLRVMGMGRDARVGPFGTIWDQLSENTSRFGVALSMESLLVRYASMVTVSIS